MKDHADYSHHCPYCGKHHNASTMVNDDPDRVPEPGMVGFCFECGEFSMVTEDRTQRRLTVDEHMEIWADPDIRKVRAAWLIVKGQIDAAKT